LNTVDELDHVFRKISVMNDRYRKFILPIILLLFFLPVEAQVARTIMEENNDLRNAMDYFSHEKYGAALRLFDAILADPSYDGTVDGAEAGYYGAVSAMRLFHPDAEYRMKYFLGSNP